MAFSLINDKMDLMNKNTISLHKSRAAAIFLSVFIVFATGSLYSQQGLPSDNNNTGKDSSLQNDFSDSDFEEFKNAGSEKRLEIVIRKAAEEENEPFFRNAYELLFIEKLYGNIPDSLEIYAEVSGEVLANIIAQPSVLKYYRIEDLKASLSFLSEYGYAKAYPSVYRLKSMKSQQAAELPSAAEDAVKNYKGSAFSNTLSVVLNNPLNDIHEVLESLYTDKRIAIAGKGRIYEEAMRHSFEYRAVDHREQSLLNNIRTLCIKRFSEYRWSEATPLVIAYFNELIGYKNIKLVSPQIIETVNCLGNMMTNEAAMRLSMYLGVINGLVENGQDYDKEIILAVIKNLGKIGDVAAFENLSNVKRNNYPHQVIREAEKSLSLLRAR